MRTRRERKFRLGLAGAVSVAMLVMLGAFGGLGYADSSVRHAMRAATNVVNPAHHSNGRFENSQGEDNNDQGEDNNDQGEDSSAGAEYGHKQQICTMQPNGKRHTINISVNAVPHYLATHPGATLGPCPAGTFTRGNNQGEDNNDQGEDNNDQ
jgi:hypothetical protein